MVSGAVINTSTEVGSWTVLFSIANHGYNIRVLKIWPRIFSHKTEDSWNPFFYSTFEQNIGYKIDNLLDE